LHFNKLEVKASHEHSLAKVSENNASSHHLKQEALEGKNDIKKIFSVEERKRDPRLLPAEFYQRQREFYYRSQVLEFDPKDKPESSNKNSSKKFIDSSEIENEQRGSLGSASASDSNKSSLLAKG
jgi:hypothetical protein